MQYQIEKWLYSDWKKDTRYYGIDLCQDLFGNWIVKRTWGSSYTRGAGQSKYTVCTDYDEALVLYENQQQRRKKRGYVLNS